jgi:UMF1 family MFS transporter
VTEERRRTLSWAFYDWANSSFATVVMAGFFPVFFKEFWASGLGAADSTFWLGLANSIASLLILVLSPLLGAIADQLGAKKRFLIVFTVLGVLASAALFWLAQGLWGMALAIYVLGLIGFSGSNIFYDAMIVDVARPADYERVSALGYALGYLGGGLLFALNVVMTLRPDWFGFDGPGEAVQAAFLGVAIWWALFSIPVALWVPEVGRRALPLATAIRGALAELSGTLGEMRRLPMTFLFLLAYWFYIDGVDTIIRMAVDYGLSLGFPANSLMVALLITQLVGFPAALVFGHLGTRWGAKRAILIAIAMYMLVILGASQMSRVAEFYALAIAIGLVQGGIQSMSRALFAALIPADESAKFFGLFNMVGKFAAVLGPALVGGAAVLTGDPRHSLLPILLLFAIGAALLWRVDVERGRAAVVARGESSDVETEPREA